MKRKGATERPFAVGASDDGKNDKNGGDGEGESDGDRENNRNRKGDGYVDNDVD